MKREKVVELILEARKQGYVEADRIFRSMLDKSSGTATIEALQAEVARLKSELGCVATAEKAFHLRGVRILELEDEVDHLKSLLKAARQKRIDRVKLATDLCKEDEEECRLAELGALVEAMPPGYSLINDPSHPGTFPWEVHTDDGRRLAWQTPIGALKAAGIELPNAAESPTEGTE